MHVARSSVATDRCAAGHLSLDNTFAIARVERNRACEVAPPMSMRALQSSRICCPHTRPHTRARPSDRARILILFARRSAGNGEQANTKRQNRKGHLSKVGHAISTLGGSCGLCAGRTIWPRACSASAYCFLRYELGLTSMLTASSRAVKSSHRGAVR